MFAHVDEPEGLPGGIERALHHGFRRAHEGVDGSIGGGSGVDVQQAAAGGPSDGRRDGVDHLTRKKNDLTLEEKLICLMEKKWIHKY